MLSGSASVQQGDLFIQDFMKKSVFSMVYDIILFLYSYYNQVHPVTNRVGLLIFSFQKLFMSTPRFECV